MVSRWPKFYCCSGRRRRIAMVDGCKTALADATGWSLDVLGVLYNKWDCSSNERNGETRRPTL